LLDALKKVLKGNAPDEKLEENAPEAVLESATPLELTNELSTQLTELAGVVESLNSVIAQKDALLAEMNGKLEALSAYAADAEAKAAEVVAQAKAKELTDKREMLANVIGADNANLDATFAAISGLDGESYALVVSGFAASYAKEAESVSFQEIGVSGEAEVPAEATGLNVKQYLSKKKEK